MQQQCVWLIGDLSRLIPDVGTPLRASLMDVRIAASAEDFLAKYSNPLGCCVICINELPGMSGIELLSKLASMRSSCVVILTSSNPSCEMAIDAFRGGAFDFILCPVKLLNLFERVQAGLKKAQSLEEQAGMRAQATLRYQSLTPRERDVLTLVVSGDSNKAVGARLNISEKTVETHRARSMRKLGAESYFALLGIMKLIETTKW